MVEGRVAFEKLWAGCPESKAIRDCTLLQFIHFGAIIGFKRCLIIKNESRQLKLKYFTVVL